MTHRVIRTSIQRSNGDVFEPGDEIEPTEAELSAFGDNLEPVQEETPDVSLDPSEYTVSELETEIEDYDSVSALQEVREAEEEGKDRATALEAIDERIDEL